MPARACLPGPWRRRGGRGSEGRCRRAPSSSRRSTRHSRRAARRARVRGCCRWSSSSGRTDRAAFEDRAIEFAVTFEVSPPSWEPPAPIVLPTKVAERNGERRDDDADAETLEWLRASSTGSVFAAARKARRFSLHGRTVVAVDLSEVERIDFVCAGAMLNLISRLEAERDGGPIRRRVADPSGAAAAHRGVAPAFRQEVGLIFRRRPGACQGRVAAGRLCATTRTHGNLSRHHHSFGTTRRDRGAGRRRAGHARQHRRQGDRAQGAAAAQRARAGRLRRRHRRRVHAVRALRGEARQASGAPDPRSRRTGRRTGGRIASCAGWRRCSRSPTAAPR